MDGLLSLVSVHVLGGITDRRHILIECERWRKELHCLDDLKSENMLKKGHWTRIPAPQSNPGKETVVLYRYHSQIECQAESSHTKEAMPVCIT